ncbi:MAG: GTP cyclohydrolase FolE2 [Candidatus Sericytochromatia bacterium]|nr:GTP cyclohydrolase FolE2 [Candidatus Sericytochromatia bacterium]
MPETLSPTLVDIQSSPDPRGVALRKVGISGVAMPLMVAGRSGVQPVQAEVALTVGLDASTKGTHMSRFVEALLPYRDVPMTTLALEGLVRDVRDRLRAPSAQVAMAFRYFVDKQAPASGLVAPTDVQVSLEGEVDATGDYLATLAVTVPMTTLCPCSKAISRYGAHNQRSLVTARLRFAGEAPTVEELVEGLDSCGSCPVYPLVKREDEKHITEQAYENPRFVEDVLREATLWARALPGITWFSLTCENLESIHNHSAWGMHEEDVPAPIPGA